MEETNKELFCARCQEITTHSGVVDSNGEFIFTCQNVVSNPDEEEVVTCGRFKKFPADITKKDFDVLVAKHEEANIGQVNLEGQEKMLKELVGSEEEETDEEPS